MWLKSLLISAVVVMSACATPPSSGSAPVQGNVTVRVENASAVDFERLALSFPGKNDTIIEIPALSAGGVSDPFTLTETYQSVAVTLTANGQPYTVEPLDIAAEPSITGGDYRYTLSLPNNTLVLAFNPDSARREMELAALIAALEAEGATVEYQDSIVRETLFDRLFGRTVTRAELLHVNGERLWLYQFDEVDTAQQAADAILPGGTALAHTRADGEIAHEFVGGVGQRLLWWQAGQWMAQLGEFTPANPATGALISAALGVTPLHSDILNGGDVQLRLANLSSVNFERVTLNVGVRETNYGELPAGRISGYLPQNGAYRYAGMTILAGGETYQFIPIDFMGETPLEPGPHTYALDITPDGQVTIAALNDSVVAPLPALAGKWYWSSYRSAPESEGGISQIPEGYEDAPPYVEFTEQQDPNQPGITFTGFGGCNAIFGSYLPTVEGQGFVGVGTGGTAQDCGAPYMESERILQDALGGIVYFNIEGSALTLYLPSGATLNFTRE